MGGTTNVFLIYTKEDSATLLQLLRHLDPIKKFEKIHFWYDDPIDPNMQWSPQIVSRFEEADVYLLLVSNTFMHSKFIQQIEFKMIIDNYRAGQSKVIPVILENCPWDINFEADDYTFNIKELHVLPEVGKPLKTWESTEKALHKCAAYIKKVIAPGAENQKQEISETKKAAALKGEANARQIAAPTSKDDKAEKMAEEISFKGEVDTQKAIVAQKSREEDQAQKRAAEKQRLQEVADAQKKANEDKSRIQEAGAKRRGLEEKRLRERMEAKAASVKVTPTKNKEKEQGIPHDKSTKRKKVIFGISVVAIVILGILLFPRNNTEASESNFQAGKETNELPNTNIDEKVPTQGAAATMSKLGIGSKYNDGIIFKIDGNGKSGILAHTQDAGPMIWNDAIIIHEQLGIGWRLPSIEELELMYQTIGQGADNSGEFADEFYWSATPYDVNQARLVRFSDGNSTFHYNSRGTHREFLVRAVRDFSQ